MRHIDISAARSTSVTLRSSTRQELARGIKSLSDCGINFSEQRLMRECLRIALKLWRGHGNMAGRNRKYNGRRGIYVIVPLYTTEALRSVAQARCHYSGMSLSRLMDFAITCYLQRVVEYWLRFSYADDDKGKTQVWRKKYESRKHRSDFIISYEAVTFRNDDQMLNYSEKTQINPWPPPLSAVA